MNWIRLRRQQKLDKVKSRVVSKTSWFTYHGKQVTVEWLNITVCYRGVTARRSQPNVPLYSIVHGHVESSRVMTKGRWPHCWSPRTRKWCGHAPFWRGASACRRLLPPPPRGAQPCAQPVDPGTRTQGTGGTWWHKSLIKILGNTVLRRHKNSDEHQHRKLAPNISTGSRL